MSRRWGRLQRAGAVALVALSGAVAIGHCALSERVPFLLPDGGPGWWMADVPVGADLMQWGSATVEATRFTRRVELAEVPPRVTLSLRALGSSRVRVNALEVPEGSAEGRSWRSLRQVELAADLRAGANEIAVEIE